MAVLTAMDPFTSLWIKFYDSTYAELQAFLTGEAGSSANASDSSNQENKASSSATAEAPNAAVAVDANRILAILGILQKITFGADGRKKAITVSDRNHNAFTLLTLLYYSWCKCTPPPSDNTNTNELKFSLSMLKSIKSIVVNSPIGREKCRIPLALAFVDDDSDSSSKTALPQIDAVYPDMLRQFTMSKSKGQQDIISLQNDKEFAEEFITTIAAICMNDDDNARIAIQVFIPFIDEVEKIHCCSGAGAASKPTNTSGLSGKILFLRTLFEAIQKDDSKKSTTEDANKTAAK
jgi:hypothetical protein